MESGLSLSVEQGPAMAMELHAMQYVTYQQVIGSLIYAAMSICPDIAFAVAILSQFMRNPERPHWEACKYTLRYLKSTGDYELTLGATDGQLEAFINADWASQPHRHLMSGYIVLLNGGPVAWSARKQPIIALSTAEAEYIALTNVVQELLYLQLLIGELYDAPSLSILILCDNQAAIVLASNSKFQSCTKHINLQYHFIHLHIKDGTFKLLYCPTDNNIADTFTKVLPLPRLQELHTMMSLACAQGGVLEYEAKGSNV